MDPKPERNEKLVSAVEEMLRDGRLEGLTGRLRVRFPSLWNEVDAAVGHAVEKLITRPTEPSEPFAYLTTCAVNELKRLASYRARYDSLDALRDGDHPWEPVYEGWSVEEQALIEATYTELLEHVSRWENNNVRTVTSIYLRAAQLGDPITSSEVAEELSDSFACEVSDEEVRTWKSRGFKRLRQYVNDAKTDH